MMKADHCSNKNWKQDELDALVFGEIRKLAIDPEYIVQIKQEKFTVDDAQKEELIQKEISKIEAQRSRFMDLYGIGMFSIEDLQSRVMELNEQKEKLEDELHALTADRSEMSVEEVQEIVSDFSGILDRGDLHEQIQLVQSLIDRIEIDGEDVYIHWKFA